MFVPFFSANFNNSRNWSRQHISREWKFSRRMENGNEREMRIIIFLYLLLRHINTLVDTQPHLHRSKNSSPIKYSSLSFSFLPITFIDIKYCLSYAISVQPLSAIVQTQKKLETWIALSLTIKAKTFLLAERLYEEIVRRNTMNEWTNVSTRGLLVKRCRAVEAVKCACNL